MRKPILSAMIVAALIGGMNACQSEEDNLLPWLMLAGLGGPELTPADHTANDGDTPANAPIELTPTPTSDSGDPDGAMPAEDGGGWGDEVIPIVSDAPAEDGTPPDAGAEPVADTQSPGDQERQPSAGTNPDQETPDEAGEAAACNKRRVQLHPEGGKWYTTGNGGDRWLHTYWQDQSLTAKILHQCRRGWVRLTIKARNIHGPLPSFYTNFHVLVQERRSGAPLGSVLIEASDSAWAEGSLLVQLEEGNPELSLVWSNDAYKANEYDANIQIGDVRIEDVDNVAAANSLSRRGSELCHSAGRFFSDEEGALYTFWKDQNVGYCFGALPSGQYRVTVEARNHGQLPLPSGYKAYDLLVAADGESAKLSVKASEQEYQNGSTILDLRSGDHLLMLTWLNDRYKEHEFDANIKIRRVSLERIGDSKRSALSAYLRGSGSGGIVAIGGILLASLIGLLTLSLYRRFRGAAT